MILSKKIFESPFYSRDSLCSTIMPVLKDMGFPTEWEKLPMWKA